jgi:hypothetical protein
MQWFSDHAEVKKKRLPDTKTSGWGARVPPIGFTQPGYDIHSLPWFFDGPNRNRWFTVLKNGGSFLGELLVITRWSFGPKCGQCGSDGQSLCLSSMV